MRILNLRTAVVLASSVSVMATTQAQYAWDVGVHVGASNYLGEMGGKEKPRRDFVWDMKLNQTRWAFGVFGRRKINRLLSVNSGLMYLRIQGADIHSTNPARVGRNLNFRNDLFEWYLRPEFTVFQDNDVGGRGRYKTDLRIFAYAGISLYYNNPKGQINRTGEYYALQPLTTELVDYSKWGAAIPAGIGMHMTKKRRHRFGFDFGWRTTFSDYLDDASTEYVDVYSLGNTLTEQLYDQRPYLEDVDPNTAGDQVETTSGEIVTVPDELQYGYDPGTPGPSAKKNNKRGDPTHNDSYLTATFTYSYVLRGQSNFYRQRYSWVRGKKRIGRKSRAKF